MSQVEALLGSRTRKAIRSWHLSGLGPKRKQESYLHRTPGSLTAIFQDEGANSVVIEYIMLSLPPSMPASRLSLCLVGV